MLSRTIRALPVSSLAPLAPVTSCLDTPVRTAVNLSALKKRIKATGNVAKLTGVMKLVASSKLKSVEDALLVGRPFGDALKAAVTIPAEVAEAPAEEAGAKKVMAVVVTTDRGLCGGVNSTVCRFARDHFAKLESSGHEVTIFGLGDKARSQIGQEYPHQMVGHLDQCLDKDPIFPLAAAIGEKLVTKDFDQICFIYNEFENAVKFNTVTAYVPTMAGFDVGVLPPTLSGYEVEPENNEEALTNMMEYAVAGLVYSIMLDSQACEVSQRIVAMDNASANAADMVDRFTLHYNRARQAKITTELTEIISGAESLVDETADD